MEQKINNDTNDHRSWHSLIRGLGVTMVKSNHGEYRARFFLPVHSHLVQSTALTTFIKIRVNRWCLDLYKRMKPTYWEWFFWKIVELSELKFPRIKSDSRSLQAHPFFFLVFINIWFSMSRDPWESWRQLVSPSMSSPRKGNTNSKKHLRGTDWTIFNTLWTDLNVWIKWEKSLQMN